ncbi:MAG: 4-alpha-glucanotransferase, partial [Gammaproteobacteria bacterium]
VIVWRGDAPPRLALSVAQAHGSAVGRWTLREEGGRTAGGDFETARLETIERRDDESGHGRYVLELPFAPPPGYHALELTIGDLSACTTLIVTTHQCAPPPNAAERPRPWGVALQLYAVRSARSWGIGDLGDLRRAVAIFARLGADVVGINPLHALYADEPERASPYSPSSRSFINPLYLDVSAVPDYAACAAAQDAVAAPAFQAELARVNETELVDYGSVAALKWPVLEHMYRHFRVCHLEPETPRGLAFRRFQQGGGETLRRFATFEVLHAVQGQRTWPDELLDPASPAVAAFAHTHDRDIEFREYLQWLLDDQLAAVADEARAGGMRIGLYRDLAVGSDAFGADVWAAPADFARDASIGAPPDDFSLQGQVWGLPPWLPERLRSSAYRQFIAALRANMRGSGALRIDHVVGLMRQFWVPSGAPASAGAFVRFPFHDLLGILALESTRAECVVIGEDLGTVPDELRAALYDYGVLSYRVLYFTKHWHGDHSFVAPEDYPPQALVTVSTHDLPTLAGFWSGRDLALREALDLFPDTETRDRLRAEREHDRTRLLDALERHGLGPSVVTDPESGLASTALIRAVHRYVARARCSIMMVQMEDVLGQLEQANVPGTVHEQPNWQRRLALPLEQWAEHAPLCELAADLARERSAS